MSSESAQSTQIRFQNEQDMGEIIYNEVEIDSEPSEERSSEATDAVAEAEDYVYEDPLLEDVFETITGDLDSSDEPEYKIQPAVPSPRKSCRVAVAKLKYSQSKQVKSCSTPGSPRKKRPIKPKAPVIDVVVDDEIEESPIPPSPRKRSPPKRFEFEAVDDIRIDYDSAEEEDDAKDGTLESGTEPSLHTRKCIVCLRQCKHLDNIFDKEKKMLYFIKTLISNLKIKLVKGSNKTVGICNECMNSLQKWHIFRRAISERHAASVSSGAEVNNEPIQYEAEESKVYRNYAKMGKVKEVFLSATHSHLTRRHLTDKDWDFFCDHLFKSNSVKSEKSKELEQYLMCPTKLSHFFCTSCGSLVPNGKEGFREHMANEHAEIPLVFPCDICGDSFPERDMTASTEDYYKHWISHFYFNNCEDCAKRFPTRRALGQHRHAVHKNRQAKCDTCGKVLANKMSLDLHRLRHLPEKEKKAFLKKCKICKRNVAQWNMNCHMATHSEDRPWKCDLCDSAFKMKGALVSHRDVVHFNLKNHVCSICSEAFKSASSLRGHVRRHEGRRDYKCEVCLKEYFTHSALKGHKLVHQTARDFVCETCGKAFKKKKSLDEHVTIHSGLKLHRCPICGREVRVKSNLYKHMKIHNRPETANQTPKVRTTKVKAPKTRAARKVFAVASEPEQYSAGNDEILLISGNEDDLNADLNTDHVSDDAPLLSSLTLTHSPEGLVTVQELPVDSMRFYGFGGHEIQIVQTIQPQDFVNGLPTNATFYTTNTQEFFTIE